MAGTNYYTIIKDTSYAYEVDRDGYVLKGKFDTIASPLTDANVYQKGCLMTKTDAAPATSTLYENTGTLAVPSWTLVGTGGGGGMAIGGAITGGTQTQVLFVGVAGILDQSTDFLWDDASKDFSVGDLANANNGTRLLVTDSAPLISARVDGLYSVTTVAGSRFLQVNTTLGSEYVYLGDIDGAGNNTTFVIDDNAQTISGFAASSTGLTSVVLGTGGNLNTSSNSASVLYSTGGNNWGFGADSAAGGTAHVYSGAVVWDWPQADASGSLISDGAGNLTFGQLPLLSANIFVGSGGNLATAVAMTGHVAISNTGVTTVSGATNLVVAGTFVCNGITNSSGPGAVAITGASHEITTTGVGDALTLANGAQGQKLSIVYVAEAGGADTAILTPTTLAGGSTITFNNIGDTALLEYHITGGWYMLGGSAVLA